MNLKLLNDYGIDYETGLARCLNDEEFYGDLLRMFLDDDSMPLSRAAMARGDFKELFQDMHALKGACGNASLTALYEAVCPLVELLRAGCDDKESITALYATVEAAYERAKEGVSLALGL